MVRIAVLLLGLALVAGCGSEEEQPASAAAPFADLVVRVDAKELKVRCTSPEESAACRAASRLKAADFEPVPGDKACTQIFGGPEKATITGELDGEAVDARFSKANGCEMARWEKVSGLLNRVR